jgi:hypothetical protein
MEKVGRIEVRLSNSVDKGEQGVYDRLRSLVGSTPGWEEAFARQRFAQRRSGHASPGASKGNYVR